MTLEELKNIIESDNLPESLVIIKYNDTDFIPDQYIRQIRKNHDVDYIDSYSQLCYNNDIFGSVNSAFKVLRVEAFDCLDESIKSSKAFIICRKINKKSEELFSDYIIDVPKLESWQIEDYAYSLAEGVRGDNIKELIESYADNIYKLDNELQKINIFDKNQREFVFTNFLDDGIFNDLSKYNIFNLSTSIIKKDIQTLSKIYENISNIDIEPVGLLTILIQNFRDVINVQLSKGSCPEVCNMKPNKYWAIKYSCGFYTKDELIQIYRFLTGLDRKIKTGEMPVNNLVDYIIVKVITCA